jgi:hypothetical protein
LIDSETEVSVQSLNFTVSYLLDTVLYISKEDALRGNLNICGAVDVCGRTSNSPVAIVPAVAFQVTKGCLVKVPAVTVEAYQGNVPLSVIAFESTIPAARGES